MSEADCISSKVARHKRHPRAYDVVELGVEPEVAHSNLEKARYGVEPRAHGTDIAGVYLHAFFLPFSDDRAPSVDGLDVPYLLSLPFSDALLLALLPGAVDLELHGLYAAVLLEHGTAHARLELDVDLQPLVHGGGLPRSAFESHQTGALLPALGPGCAP